jgi:hypothetical protein
MFSGSDFHTFFIAGVGCAGSFLVFLDGTRIGDRRYVVLVFRVWIAEKAFDDDEVWCMYCNHKTLRDDVNNVSFISSTLGLQHASRFD